MSYIKSQVEEKYSSQDGVEVAVYTASSFENYYTYDGIDVCGTRVADETQREVSRLNQTSPVVKISFVGYSLGGLISRYALGLLYQRGLFDHVKPTNFTTFASPHVGVIALGTGFTSKLFNNLAQFALAYTSRQLFLTDQVSHYGNRPILECLADPALPFFQALECFEHRSLYSNVVNDHSTPWHTSGVDMCNPYTPNAARIRGPYVEGYGPVVIDHYKQLQLLATPAHEEIETVTEGVLRRAMGRLSRWTSVLVNVGIMTVTLPVIVFAKCANVSYQSISAAIRKRMFVNSEVFSYFHGYIGDPPTDDTGTEEHTPLISGQFQEQPRAVMDSVFEAVNINYDHAEQPLHESTLYSTEKSKHSEEEEEEEEDNNTVAAPAITEKDILNLNTVQKTIITNLNTLTWRKFPIYIRKDKHSHAAMICRFPSPDFEEGVVVINHWMEQVFVM